MFAVCEPLLDYVKSHGPKFTLTQRAVSEIRLKLMEFDCGRYREKVEQFPTVRIVNWLHSAYRALYKLKIKVGLCENVAERSNG